MLIGAYLERFFRLIGAGLMHEIRRFTVSQIRGLVHQKVSVGTRTPRVIFDFLVQNFGCPNVAIFHNIFKDLLKDLIMLFNFVNSLNVSHVFEFLYRTLWIQRWEFKLPLMLIDRDYVLVLGYWTLILVYLLWGRQNHDTRACGASLLVMIAFLLAHSDLVLLVHQILLVLG